MIFILLHPSFSLLLSFPLVLPARGR